MNSFLRLFYIVRPFFFRLHPSPVSTALLQLLVFKSSLTSLVTLSLHRALSLPMCRLNSTFWKFVFLACVRRLPHPIRQKNPIFLDQLLASSTACPNIPHGFIFFLCLQRTIFTVPGLTMVFHVPLVSSFLFCL